MQTNSILDEICRRKRIDLDAEKDLLGFDEIYRRALESPARASFKAALSKRGMVPNVIAELKKASPSRGLIRPEFDVASLARGLEGAGASALSVLTETHYFLGGDKNLEIAAQTVKIPLLCKDFIFDEYQICKARLLGASAVLLIVRMLEASSLERLMAFAKGLGLDVLCETHNESEIAAACDAGADIIGVNCRNLASFETDFGIVERQLSKVPSGAVKVAESAIEDARMLLRAKNAGADAALIGTALMSKADPAKALSEMISHGR